MFFLVPDGPGLAEAIRGTAAIPVEASRQSTNSWGLRGPEPDLDAPLRGIVLGDSFMQGMFIGDDDTPPECLRRDLEERLKTRVSILNTGHLGYSPEQYYYSLVEYADRFRPHFVVVSVFANDFGERQSRAWHSRARAIGTRASTGWRRSLQFCRSRGWTYLVVPAPYEPILLGKRKAGHYPGELSNILEETEPDVPRPQRRLAQRPSRAGRRRRTSRQEALRAARSSTSRSTTATSLPWARKPGPRPWAGGSRSCSTGNPAITTEETLTG